MQDGDPVCDNEVNQGLFDRVPDTYRPFRNVITDAAVTRTNIQGANTSVALTLSLFYDLTLGAAQPLDNCASIFDEEEGDD